jgi:hypothetical protein
MDKAQDEDNLLVAARNIKWRRVAEVPFQKLDYETIVIDPRRREVHLLNETAARVWELCGSPQTVDDLVAALGEDYDTIADDLRSAVVELLNGLRNKSLLVNT